jgi:hypothetical protein
MISQKYLLLSSENSTLPMAVSVQQSSYPLRRSIDLALAKNIRGQFRDRQKITLKKSGQD